MISRAGSSGDFQSRSVVIQLRYVTADELASLVGDPLPNWPPYLTQRKAS